MPQCCALLNHCTHCANRAEVLEAPGSTHLMVTHKSILRALLCVALGLPPTSFRAFDIHNGGICNFRRARAFVGARDEDTHTHAHAEASEEGFLLAMGLLATGTIS